jgi:hypothetical protein
VVVVVVFEVGATGVSLHSTQAEVVALVGATGVALVVTSTQPFVVVVVVVVCEVGATGVSLQTRGVVVVVVVVCEDGLTGTFDQTMAVVVSATGVEVPQLDETSSHALEVTEVGATGEGELDVVTSTH